MSPLTQGAKRLGRKRPVAVIGVAAVAALALTAAIVEPSWGAPGGAAGVAAPGFGGSVVLTGAAGGGTTTPIKHVVVIFDENVSFDHYFGTYPNAANTDGTAFHAKPGTPTVNGLTTALLDDQPERRQPAAAEPRRRR